MSTVVDTTRTQAFGEGVAIRMLAERFARSRFVGADIAAEAIATARDPLNAYYVCRP